MPLGYVLTSSYGEYSISAHSYHVPSRIHDIFILKAHRGLSTLREREENVPQPRLKRGLQVSFEDGRKARGCLQAHGGIPWLVFHTSKSVECFYCTTGMVC